MAGSGRLGPTPAKDRVPGRLTGDAGRRTIEHMFDESTSPSSPGTAHDAGAVLHAAGVVGWKDSLASAASALESGEGLGDAEMVDLISALEGLKAAAAAAQARVTTAFDASQHAALAEDSSQRQHRLMTRSVAGQVALARRDSRHRGNQHLGLARALCGEMPHTLTALTTGATSEWRATVMVRETACLSVEDRRAVDRLVGPRLAKLGDREVEAEARRACYRIDPVSVTRRSSHAHSDRNVSIRPAPDTMTRLSGFLPVKDGVACWAALSAAVNAAIDRKAHV